MNEQNSTKANINWYPGHMAKTRRIMTEKMKLVDIVAELRDARVPFSSRNPDLDDICKNKSRIILLNKSDMADEMVTKLWVDWYNSKGIKVIPLCAISGAGISEFKSVVRASLSEKFERNATRGMTGRSVKIMVVGIPNVGKSAFINKIAGRSVAAVGDRPGVTRTEQWVVFDKNYEILDTPGVLWPKFEDETVALNLALTGSIKDQIMDVEALAVKLCSFFKKNYTQLFKERYLLEDISELEDYEILETIGRKRGFLLPGAEVDTERAANVLLYELRGTKIGKISLERPEDLINAKF